MRRAASVQATHFEKSLEVKRFARAFDEPLVYSSRAVTTSYTGPTLNPKSRSLTLFLFGVPKIYILSTGVEPEVILGPQNEARELQIKPGSLK